MIWQETPSITGKKGREKKKKREKIVIRKRLSPLKFPKCKNKIKQRMKIIVKTQCLKQSAVFYGGEDNLPFFPAIL